jgi:antitoxin (DNA-binding transcriptional repressor) of toxin-antitoxin stability system
VSVASLLADAPASDYSVVMKTVTVEEVENDFPAVLRMVRSGGEVQVMQEQTPIAKIVRLPEVSSNRSSVKLRKAAWAVHAKKLQTIYEEKNAPGKCASEIIIEGRR